MSRSSDVYFDAGLQGWIKNTARQEHWRMAKWYGLADLFQDGVLCYCKCRDKYTRGPPEPGFQALNTITPNDAQRRHFMQLVQRSFWNHIMTLSSRFAAMREELAATAARRGIGAFGVEAGASRDR
jgi:hypothetical protein